MLDQQIQAVSRFNARQSDDVHKHRKENSFRRQLSLIDRATGEEVVTVRFYGNGSRAYCCVWTGKSGTHARGSAWAGGYGYHRDSEAMERALENAGFGFIAPFGGTGETGERDALEAIARWFGVISFMIVKANP